jgi:hypothetical protein
LADHYREETRMTIDRNPAWLLLADAPRAGELVEVKMDVPRRAR